MCDGDERRQPLEAQPCGQVLPACTTGPPYETDANTATLAGRATMLRHGITADDAFLRLRRQARNANRTVNDVAEAVTLNYSLFGERRPTGDGADAP